MAEIKSAIELAMEKTRDLVVSSEEREAMAMREIEDKVKAVLRRYVEEMVDADDASKELDRISADKALKKAIIVDTLVEEFDVHKDNERLLALFSAAGIELPQSLRSELERLNNAFREEVEAREMVSRKKIRDDLAGLGVAGSAVEVNLAAWDEWREEVEKAADVFRKNMETLKEKVKTTSGHVLKQV